MKLKTTRFLIRLLMRLLTRVVVTGKEHIPADENYIIASNHLGLVDAFLPFFILDNENLFLLVGEKWEKLAILRWLGKRLNFIFVDRFNPDLKAIRQVISRMKQGEVLVITPEGTRSKVGHLIEGKQGVSYLAAKLGYPILPVGITGSFDPHFFDQLKRFKRPLLKVNVGPSFRLSPLPSESQEREQVLNSYTDEIMCRIAALLPNEFRGFYAQHPGVQEYLEK